MSMVAILIVVGGGLVAAAVAVARRGQDTDASRPGAAPRPDIAAFDDEGFREHVLAEIEAGRRIQAIKLVRERTQLGLAEAKALVEALEAGAESVDLDLAPTSSLDNAKVALDDPDLAAQLVVELAAGRKLEAIKLLRERTGLGLKEAKDAIEALEREG